MIPSFASDGGFEFRRREGGAHQEKQIWNASARVSCIHRTRSKKSVMATRPERVGESLL